MVETDATCSLAWTSSATVTATATTSAQRMAAGETRFYMVDPGGSLSVVSNS
jgi:paraquat-inducible protein B